MLLSLAIENIAVIRQCEIEFQGGFSVLTGETGAGKSIIIDSINLILGGRTSKELIRAGAQRARVEALFQSENPAVEQLLCDMGIEYENGELLITREISADGRSICRMNGRTVTALALRQVGTHLITIHGQHDNQLLLDPVNHIGILDRFGNISLDRYGELYHKAGNLKKQLRELKMSDDDKTTKEDLYSFQINEISQADLKLGEDEALLEERKLLMNAEKIADSLNAAFVLLYGGEMTVHDALAECVQKLESISNVDEKLAGFYEKLQGCLIELDDISFELRDFGESVSFDAQRLEEIEQRLDLISKMKRKYGDTIEEVLDFLHRREQDLERIVNNEEAVLALEKELLETEDELKAEAGRIYERRKEAAEAMQDEISRQLWSLEMNRVLFEIEINHGTMLENGFDTVEFLISTNPGEPPKPLAKIASGGELSRIMLAVQAALSDIDDVETMIFDEIDTGVSGRAAQKIAVKMALISKSRQVLSVTHLAQIAAMADEHFLIEKSVEGGRSVTEVSRLTAEGRCEELARIIGGAQITQLTRNTGLQMLRLAKAEKKNL